MAAIVGSMCQQVVAAVKVPSLAAHLGWFTFCCQPLPFWTPLLSDYIAQAGNGQVEEDARRLGQYAADEPVDSAPELAHRLLTTVYMGTVNSSSETRSRAADLAEQARLAG